MHTCLCCGCSDFYPRSPCGERLPIVPAELVTLVFLSTLSLRRATICRIKVCIDNADFYPRSPCGERPILDYFSAVMRQFLSTLSLRRATSTTLTFPGFGVISIHALLAESDGINRVKRLLPSWISIHALLAESDKIPFPTSDKVPPSFLSTLSLRRATKNAITAVPQQEFLSTLSLRRATAKVHKTVGHFCAYETNFMEIASSC